MNDQGILFSAPMVRAILRDQKRVTRREGTLIKGIDVNSLEYRDLPDGFTRAAVFTANHFRPRFKSGQRLWVRENFQGARGYDTMKPRDWGNKPVWYSADGEPGNDWWFISKKKRPAIHMPRRISRITVDVTSVEIQQLGDMTEEDALDEGIEELPDGFGLPGYDECQGHETAMSAFRRLWININQHWDDHFWVEAIRFIPYKTNIDQIPARAA